MKKLFLLLTVVMAFAFCAKAQISLVATLSHKGQISTFYSTQALEYAYEAAVDGDIITLSAGSFESPGTIKKNITIRGAGMMNDYNLTAIQNMVYINTEQSPDSTLHFTAEGIYFNKVQVNSESFIPEFVKCRFGYLWGTAIQGRIINSIIECGTTFNGFNIINSYISNRQNYSLNFDDIDLLNCVINDNYHVYIDGVMTNCLIISDNEISSNSAVIRSCIAISNKPTFFNQNNVVNYDNQVFDSTTDVFKEGTTTYELTDANKAAWIGSDGTEIGMHGGQFPFTTQLSNPQITKFEVAPKTDSEGKLSVKIEVKAN